MEFGEHGLGEMVTGRHRDVCADGFDIVGRADAVFLDLLILGRLSSMLKML